MQRKEHSVVSKCRRVLYSILLCGIAVSTVCTVCNARASKKGSRLITGGVSDAVVSTQASEVEESAAATQKTMTFFDVPLSSELQQYLFAECEKSGVPAELAIAVMSAESNYQPDVVSPTSDYGLMQINRVNHTWLKDRLEISDLLDPEQNISAGVYILSDLWERYGNYNDVLMAYNLGIGGADRARARGVTSTKYSEKVLNIMQELNYCTRVIEENGSESDEDGQTQELSEAAIEEEDEQPQEVPQVQAVTMETENGNEPIKLRMGQE